MELQFMGRYIHQRAVIFHIVGVADEFELQKIPMIVIRAQADASLMLQSTMASIHSYILTCFTRMLDSP